MDTVFALCGALIVAVFVGLAWQIRRDLRKSRCTDCKELIEPGWLINGLCLGCRLNRQQGFLAAVARQNRETLARLEQEKSSTPARLEKKRSKTPDADRLLEQLKREHRCDG